MIKTAGWASSHGSTYSPARRAAAAARLTTAATKAAGSVPVAGSVAATASFAWLVAAGSCRKKLAAAALAAWQRRGLGGSVAVGRSTVPARLAVEIIPLELLVHGWDIARATGSQIDIAPEVADYVLGRARELITEDKRGRSFAAEVPAGPEATVLERLTAGSRHAVSRPSR